MTSAYSINLNFNNTIPVKTDFTFKQGDKGITLNLATTGLDPAGTTAHIVFKRSNGTSVEAELTGQTGPSYSYTILGNEFEIPGVVVADLKLYNGDTQRVSTASFIFLVTGDTMDGVGGGTGGYSDQLEELSQEFSDTLEEYKDAFGDVGAVNPRGAYDSTADYNVLDLVSYQGSSYLCRTACKNKVPTNTTYWQVFAAGGGITPDADEVSYDNTTSQLTADNVQDALDELAARPSGGGTAEDVSYDNTSSGLVANDVQDAIDETNGRITNLYNMTGGKNQLVYPYAETSRVHNGITFTDNGDGTIKATGTASGGNAVFYIINNTAFSLKTGNYILNGCPGGGSQNGYWIGIQIGSATIAADVGNSDNFSLSSDNPTGYIFIAIMNGTALPTGGITFKPMIRDASISDDTYVPYAMTNRELTERVNANNIGTYIDISSYTSSSNMYTFPSDGYVALNSNTVSSGIIGCVISGANDIGFNKKMNILQQYQTEPIFVKKGMKAYFNTVISGAQLRFHPLT